MLFSKRLSLSVLAVAALLANAAPVPRYARRSLELTSRSPRPPTDAEMATLAVLAKAHGSNMDMDQIAAAFSSLLALPASIPTGTILPAPVIPVATLPPPVLPVVTGLPPTPTPSPVVVPIPSPSPTAVSRIIVGMPVVSPQPNPSGSIGTAVPPVAVSVTTTTQTVTTTVSGAQPTKKCDPNNKKNKVITKEDHEDPTKTITLYHAVADDDNRMQMLLAGPQANQRGDFNAHGAFYTTDNSQAAAQYACYSGKIKKSIAMFEYEWNPVGAKIYQFSSANWQWRSFIKAKGSNTNIIASDMVAGPLRPQKDIARNFWQYAVSQSGLPRLKLRSVDRGLMCSDIPKGDLCT